MCKEPGFEVILLLLFSPRLSAHVNEAGDPRSLHRGEQQHVALLLEPSPAF